MTAGVHVLTPGQKVKLVRPSALPASAARLPRSAASVAVTLSEAPPRCRPCDAAAPSRFNISRWALEHPALTRYLMVVLMVLGFAAYFQLGQDEDPPFTFRAMVVQRLLAGRDARSRWPSR